MHLLKDGTGKNLKIELKISLKNICTVQLCIWSLINHHATMHVVMYHPVKIIGKVECLLLDLIISLTRIHSVVDL